jgi:outer membrane protein OmpA-like peptidoglycan-associated protein
MGFSSFWRIETEVGYVEVELDFEGGPLTDPEDIFDSQGAVDQLTYAIENRNPRTTAVVLEIYAQLHPERFPPGLSLKSLDTRDIDPMRSELMRFIEDAVESGILRVFSAEPIMGRMPDEFDEAPVYEPQPLVPEKESFIGVRVKDQDGKPVPNTQVRITLPDGDVRYGRTNRDGVLKVTGFTVDGMAQVEFLDFSEAGAALPVDDDDPVTPQPVEQPFTVKLVDETGKVGIDGIVLVFRTAEKEEPVTTDGSGVAQWKAAAEDATVTVKDEKALCDKMSALWKSRPATPQSDYVKPSGDVSTAAARTTALETDDGGPFGSLTVPAKGTRVLSVHPAKKRAVIIEMHDTLFRNDSAVVNPEGEAPSSKVGEHESISTVGLIATILRYNEEHPGKKLFIGGHTDRAGSEKGNVKLSEHRAAAVLALIEGDQAAYVAACKAKHSEVDVTQLMDWTNKTYQFKCKPTKLTAAPSDENYVLFRKSYNDWCKGPVDTAEGEIGPRGTAIGPYGRLQDDIWAAMFELYEHNLRQELGEDAAAVQALRGKVTWVSDSKKLVGYGESHPTAKNTIDGTRSQADRRVEVFLFDEKDAPDLEATQGADVYDGVTFEKKTVEPLVSAKPWKAEWDEIATWMSESREMQLRAPGLPDGETVQFAVEAVGYGKAGTVQGAAAGEIASANFASWDEMAGYQDAGELAPGASFPKVRFKFVAEAGGRRVTSRNQVEYTDRLLMKLVAETAQGDYVFANERYSVVTPWGRRWGTTDKDGIVEEAGLAPGGAAVVLRGRTLVTFGELKQGWHYDA